MRSLLVVEDLRPNDKFSSQNVRVIRPGGGLEPKHLDQVMGKALVAGTLLTWEAL